MFGQSLSSAELNVQSVSKILGKFVTSEKNMHGIFRKKLTLFYMLPLKLIVEAT